MLKINNSIFFPINSKWILNVNEIREKIPPKCQMKNCLHVSQKKQKERQKSIAYLVGVRIGGCGVDLAILLKERRLQNVLHSALSFPFNLIPFDDEQIWSTSFMEKREGKIWSTLFMVQLLAELLLQSSLVMELGVRSSGLGRTIVGVLGEEEQDRGENVLEEALANVIRRRRHQVEVVVPATAPFQKSEEESKRENQRATIRESD